MVKAKAQGASARCGHNSSPVDLNCHFRSCCLCVTVCMCTHFCCCQCSSGASTSGAAAASAPSTATPTSAPPSSGDLDLGGLVRSFLAPLFHRFSPKYYKLRQYWSMGACQLTLQSAVSLVIVDVDGSASTHSASTALRFQPHVWKAIDDNAVVLIGSGRNG